MAHQFHFFRAGGVDQVSIRSGADLSALRELDKKLWVALAMPTRDVEIDAATLDLLDADRDGRIRVPDILSAIDWIAATWRDVNYVLRSADAVPLYEIKDPKIASAARRVLSDLGKAAAEQVSLDDVSDVAKALADTKLNGDGVVTRDSADDDDTRALIDEIIAAVGSVSDRSGKPGVNRAHADQFFGAIDATAAWLRGCDAPGVMALGADTETAAVGLQAVRTKVEDFFTRCRVAAFEPRAAVSLNGQDTALAELGGVSLSPSAEQLARLPLARVAAKANLPLNGELNPAWTDRVTAFADRAVKPLLGSRAVLSETDFSSVVEKLRPFESWRSAKPVNVAGALSDERVRALAAPEPRARLFDLIAADQALADDYEQVKAVEKAVRFQRDFARILRNFVSFSDFYSDKNGAFQVGTLYIDRRACKLCVSVSDAAKHGSLAALSGAYLVYCDITRSGEKKAICALVTNGDADNLMVGRNGVFFDRQGRDWDATITKIVSNPISVREGFWAPYKKLARMVDEQVAKRAAAGEAAATTRLETTAGAVAHADKTAAASAEADKTKPATEPRKIDVGTVAAIGVAIGGIGAMVVGIMSSFLGLGRWLPLGIAALVLMISGPSMLLAWLKLRQRNLGPILDANGWALNSRARINVTFGAVLTDVAALPPGSKRSLDDPYADKKSPWRFYLFLVVVLLLGGAWYVGKLDRYLPDSARSTSVLGKHAPAANGTEEP